MQVLMSKYIYKKLRHLFTKKLYFGFFQTFKDSCDYLCETSIKTNVATDEGKGRN